jgi:hypothetical protein
VTCEALTTVHLERWALSGAHWRVVEITGRHVVVDLCACTGEPVERLQSDDHVVIAYLTAAPTDLDMRSPPPGAG